MTAGTAVCLVLAICFWGVVITLCVRWRIRDRRNSKQRATERQAIIERLLHPDWNFFERHLRRPVPAALRQLFAEPHLITACGLDYEKDNGLSSFNPLDKDSLLDDETIQLGHDIVPFATSDCGDAIYLRPGAAEPDTVYMAYHDDPGNVQVFAESVAVMVEKLKALNFTTKSRA